MIGSGLADQSLAYLSSLGLTDINNPVGILFYPAASPPQADLRVDSFVALQAELLVIDQVTRRTTRFTEFIRLVEIQQIR